MLIYIIIVPTIVKAWFFKLGVAINYYYLSVPRYFLGVMLFGNSIILINSLTSLFIDLAV